MKFQSCFLAVTVLLTMGAVGSASAACSNATITGVWGYEVGAAVGHFTSDGKGNITAGSQMISVNGIIDTQTYSGTYSVLGNCSGTLTFNFTGGGSAVSNFVLDQGKKGAQVILNAPGAVAVGISVPQGVVTCGLTGKKAIFAGLFFGAVVGTGPGASVLQLSLDGKGNAKGFGTFDVNGSIDTGNFTGPYTENPDCTGTMTLTVTGSSANHYYFVVVNGGKELLALDTDTGTAIIGNLLQ